MSPVNIFCFSLTIPSIGLTMKEERGVNMYQSYYRKHMLKSGLIITALLVFAIFSTYHIYHKFINQRETDYDSGQMEVVFHEKQGNQITLTQFTPVTDAVGLASHSYTFTVKNNTNQAVQYKIVLAEDQQAMVACGCVDRQIPRELLKVSLRKDHQAPISYVLGEITDGVLLSDVLEANSEEDYSLRIWGMQSNFIVDRTSHFHASIQVIEE